MDTVTRVKILSETVSISQYTNTFGKSMNSTLLSPAIGTTTDLGEVKLWIQSCYTYKIDLVWDAARAEKKC